MDNRYKDLFLNGHEYSAETLFTLAENIIRSMSAPGWQKKIYLFIEEWLSDSQTIEARTSGSTGSPKLIHLSKKDMVNSAKRTGDYFNLKPGDSALLCLPVDYIAGKMMIVRSFVLGLNLYYVNPVSNPLEFFEGKADFSAMTPMQVHKILNTPEGLAKLDNIRNLIIGGADVDPLLAHKLKDLKTNICSSYGMTETITHIAMRKLSGPDQGTDFHVLDGVSVGKDQNDCLVIRDEVLNIDGLKTNDLVEMIGADSFRVLGRADTVINSGGIKVIPEQVEKKLSLHIKNRLVIIAKNDAVLGEKVVLIIEEGKAGRPADLNQKIEAAGLSKYETPREVFYTHKFPESGSGKILRTQMTGLISSD